MNVDINKIWMALGELEAHVSSFGGAARYRNMSESEIPLYIACVLALRVEPHFKADDYLNPEFVAAAAPIIEKTNNLLSAVQASGDELVELLIEFAKYADSKLAPTSKGPAWTRFIKRYQQAL